METWPSQFIPQSMNWHLQYNSKSFKSTFNQSVNTHRFPGGMWQAQLQFKNLTRAQSDSLRVFLYRLGGANGRFLLWDFTKPGKPVMGNPVVAQNSQTGGLLLTSGWLPNRLILQAGEYFSVNNELKMVMNDVWSSSIGFATLEFEPWLRKSPKQGAPIVTETPTGMFKLIDDKQGNFQYRALFSDVSIAVEEAFYV